MANRMILNETSYFGAGSISEIVTEAKKRAFKKALVVTDPDLRSEEHTSELQSHA